MTEDRATAYRALLSQALFDGDFFAVRGRQGDKAIANRFYNLLPMIAELRQADRGAKGTAMNDKALVSEEMVMRACVRYMEAFHVTGPITSDDVYAMRAALQAALGVGGWRPIAEAPKDKQFFAADMHFDIGIAYWHEKNPYWGIPDRYEWVTSGWGDSPPPVYYLPSPPPSSEEG